MVREAPKEWAEALGDLGRPKDNLSHVEIWWDDSCNRWVLVECVPPQGVGDALRLSLFEHPNQTPFRTRQSEAYKATGKIPLVFWVIQGDQGGHRTMYGEHEATLAQFYGGSREPPVAGSLPYAPFDNRVLAALRGYDRAMSKFATLQAAYDGDAQAALEQMRRDMLAETSEAVRDSARDMAPLLQDADVPVVDGPPPDYDQAYDHFVTTGDMEGARAGGFKQGGQTTVPLITK